MERTCEIIISNDGVDPEDVLRGLKNDTSNDAALARQLAQQGGGREGGERTQTHQQRRQEPAASKGKGTPTTLPVDYLRIPGYSGVGGASHSGVLKNSGGQQGGRVRQGDGGGEGGGDRASRGGGGERERSEGLEGSDS